MKMGLFFEIDMENKQRKYELYHVVLMYLAGKITENLRKLYMDVDFHMGRIMLTAFYQTQPTDLELELLDDIVTNSNAPIPDLFVMYRLN